MRILTFKRLLGLAAIGYGYNYAKKHGGVSNAWNELMGKARMAIDRGRQTVIAAIGVVIAIILIVKFQTSSEEAAEKQRQAEVEKEKAVKAAQEAQALVDRLQRDLADMDKKVSAAVDGVVAAQNDADRASAKAKLQELNRQKYEMEKRIAEAKAAAARAERLKGAKVSAECANNPLAKGCM